MRNCNLLRSDDGVNVHPITARDHTGIGMCVEGAKMACKRVLLSTRQELLPPQVLEFLP